MTWYPLDDERRARFETNTGVSGQLLVHTRTSFGLHFVDVWSEERIVWSGANSDFRALCE